MQKFNDIQRNDIDQYGKDVVNTKALASKIFMWVIVRLKPKGKYYEFIDVAYTEKLAKIKLRNIVYGSDYTYEKRKLFKEYEIWKWPIIRKVEEAEKKC
ncbi:MAG: hypothetical protein GTO02_21725 [Candidatus Dadabacteria bacterium]|nr:hypothetical protein [Candidatus Dadabacteria bacterium]